MTIIKKRGKEIIKLLDRLFNDITVPPSTTRAEMEEIKRHVESLIEVLPEEKRSA